MTIATLDDLSVRVSASTADFQAGAERVESQLGDLSSESIQTAAAMEILSNRTDDAGDNISQTGRRATVAAGQMSGLSSSVSLANVSFMGLSATTVGSLIPAVVALGAALAPVVGALGGFVAVGAAIGGIGIIGAIAAIATNTERLKEEALAVVDELQTAFAPAIELATEVLSILLDEFSDIIPELVPAQDVLQQLAGDFANLGEVLIDSLPMFVELATTLTTEFLPPFIEWLEDILPEIPGMIMSLVDIMDRMIPRFRRAGSVLLDFLGPFTEFGFTVLNVLGPALTRLLNIGTNVLTWFNQLSSEIQQLGARLSLTAPAISVLVGILGGPLTAALGLGIAAIIGFRNAWQTNFADIRSYLTGLWTQIQSIFPAIQNAFDAFVSGIDFAAIEQSVSDLESALGTQLMTTLEALKPVFSDIKQLLNDNQEEFRLMGEAASALISIGIDLATVFINLIYPAIRTLVIPAIRAAIDTLDFLIDKIGTAIELSQAISSGDFEAATQIGLEATGQQGEFQNIQQQLSADQGQRQSLNERIEVFVTGDTEVVGEVAAEVVNERKRRATRNTGGTSGL